MRVTVQLTQVEPRQAVLNELIDFIEINSSTHTPLKTRGVYFEQLNGQQVANVKQTLEELNYSSFNTTDTTVRLFGAKGDLGSLTAILKSILLADEGIAKLHWGRGFILETIGNQEADLLKQRLEAESARVTITADLPERQYFVFGQVLRPDNTPFLRKAISFGLTILFPRVLSLPSAGLSTCNPEVTTTLPIIGNRSRSVKAPTFAFSSSLLRGNPLLQPTNQTPAHKKAWISFSAHRTIKPSPSLASFKTQLPVTLKPMLPSRLFFALTIELC